MGPVHNTALGVPGEFAAELEGVALRQGRDAAGQFEVVRNQHSVTRGQAHDEALVRNALTIVGENFYDRARALHVHAFGVRGDGLFQRGASRKRGTPRRSRLRLRRRLDVDCAQPDDACGRHCNYQQCLVQVRAHLFTRDSRLIGRPGSSSRPAMIYTGTDEEP